MFQRPFDKRHGKRAQAMWKYGSEDLYHIHWSLPRKLSWKKSLLLTCKILGLLLNTLATDEKYPVLNRDNSMLPIQRQLFQKQKIFLRVFSTFLKFILNLEYFETKTDPHIFFISEITASENVVI